MTPLHRHARVPLRGQLHELGSIAPALIAVALAGCRSDDAHLNGPIDDASSNDADATEQTIEGGTQALPDSGTTLNEACDVCLGANYVPCNEDGSPGERVACPTGGCIPGTGCLACAPGVIQCVGNELRLCDASGTRLDEVVETCDVDAGLICRGGACTSACDAAAEQPSNIGCEFWAVDLDQQDYFDDPASAPWGVALSNTGAGRTHVVIALNDSPAGEPPSPRTVREVDVEAGALSMIVLPTRELDCGTMPNDYASPGTCLSSQAYRISASSPIVVYQFNAFENTYSNDASLLLPTNALGKLYRVLGWPAENPGYPVVPGLTLVDRASVTVVGTKPGTLVHVKPSWRIRGNSPIAATLPDGDIRVTVGPFDVLNLETDDATASDEPVTRADLTATLVSATEPVAVFSGVETTTAPAGVLDIPTPPSWLPNSSGCCADHLEEQMFPIESVGSQYVITRSALRSQTEFREPDIIRFVGVAEEAQVKTSLPAPFDSFVLRVGEVRTTWTQENFVVTASKPVMLGQVLASGSYVDGASLGDPSLTIYPPVSQFRRDYVVPTPASWPQNWLVVAAEVGARVTLDGASTEDCSTEPAGTVDGTLYESRACPVTEGTHRLEGEAPFGVTAYGYGSAGSYAFAGGADVKRVYEPPPLL